MLDTLYPLYKSGYDFQNVPLHLKCIITSQCCTQHCVLADAFWRHTLLPSWMCPNTCSLGCTLLWTVLSSSMHPTRCIFFGTQSKNPADSDMHVKLLQRQQAAAGAAAQPWHNETGKQWVGTRHRECLIILHWKETMTYFLICFLT